MTEHEGRPPSKQAPAEDEAETDPVEEVEWLTPQQIAKKLQVNQQSVRNWLRDGLLTGATFGSVWRVHRRDFEHFVNDAIKRGKRYEPGPEIRSLIESHGYSLRQSFGDGNSAAIIVDDVSPDSNEVCISSNKLKEGHDNMQARFEGTLFIEDQDYQPYTDIAVAGDSHSEVFRKIIEILSEFNLKTAK